MNRGDVKLMIDRLQNRINDSHMDNERLMDDAIDMLGQLADENDIGKQMCGRLMAELGEKNDQIVQLKAALTICADQFDAYAEHHLDKAEVLDSNTPEFEAAYAKFQRNRMLANDAREALK